MRVSSLIRCMVKFVSETLSVRAVEEPEAKVDPISLVHLLCDTRATVSRSQARRLIACGGVTVDGERAKGIGTEVELVDGMVITVGKRTTLTREGKVWKVEIAKKS